MKLFYIIFHFFLSVSVYADYPYNTRIDSNLHETSRFDVSNMPPTMSQDSVGICYGFSSTLLLGNYRCKELRVSCNNKNELLSPLDVTSYNSKFIPNQPNSLKTGGDPVYILSNLKNTFKGNKKIAMEFFN